MRETRRQLEGAAATVRVVGQSSFQRGSLSQVSLRSATFSSACSASSRVRYGPRRSVTLVTWLSGTTEWVLRSYHQSPSAIVPPRSRHRRRYSPGPGATRAQLLPNLAAATEGFRAAARFVSGLGWPVVRCS